MRWQLEWGKVAKILAKRAARGKSTPAWDNRPVPFDDVLWIWVGFLDLHRQRSVGFGPSPISLIDLKTWLDLNNVHRFDERDEFLRLVIALDDEWLRWAHKNLTPDTEDDEDGDAPASNRQHKGRDRSASVRQRR